MLASGHQGVKGTVSDGTGCHQQQFKAQRRRGQTLRRKNQPKISQLGREYQLNFQWWGLKDLTLALSKSSYSSHATETAIKSENMRAGIQRGKTSPGSSNHLFFIRPKRLCIISLFISCWLAVINASFVETIKLLNFRSAGFVKQSTLDFHRFGIVNCLREVHICGG